MSHEPVVQTVELDKRYGRVHALRGLTLSVPSGPVGLLGPNGAGKSTLLKLLLGQLRPDGGAASILGFDPARGNERLELRRSVGYMPEGDCLVPRTNAVELVSTLGRLSGLTFRDAMTRAHEVLDYVGLDESRYRECDGYSTGMKQRLKLAQALVHDPDLLLLDEPTNGLDPAGRRHMLELVHDLGHTQGKSLLFCSHLLPDVERTCETVVVIHRGNVIDSGSIAELTASDERWIRIEVDGAVQEFAARLEAQELVHRRPATRVFEVCTDAPDGDALFSLARECGTSVGSLTVVRSSLEDVFLNALDEAESA